jgi:hypothetical protein
MAATNDIKYFKQAVFLYSFRCEMPFRGRANGIICNELLNCAVLCCEWLIME